MKLDDARESENVEDRRGGGGVMRGLTLGRGGLGIGGVILVLIASYALGIDPSQLLSSGSSPGSSDPSVSAPASRPGSDPMEKFVAKILADTEDTWTPIVERAGLRYTKPVLVLYSGSVDSACGMSSAAMGPFYCPNDQKVYLDLSFFRELDSRFGAPGDFAQAYVIAHEVGHHVQNLFGALSTRSGLSGARANAQSVRQELQADCLAGVWGHAAAARGILQTGDAEEGLTAAAAIGDDTLQRATQGRVVPDSFTHGSSADRVAALKSGLRSGELVTCGLGR